LLWIAGQKRGVNLFAFGVISHRQGAAFARDVKIAQNAIWSNEDPAAYPEAPHALNACRNMGSRQSTHDTAVLLGLNLFGRRRYREGRKWGCKRFPGVCNKRRSKRRRQTQVWR
jgi:hypothetical protein